MVAWTSSPGVPVQAYGCGGAGSEAAVVALGAVGVSVEVFMVLYQDNVLERFVE